MNNENVIKDFVLELDREVQIINNQGKIREFSSKEVMNNTIGTKGEYVLLAPSSQPVEAGAQMRNITLKENIVLDAPIEEHLDIGLSFVEGDGMALIVLDPTFICFYTMMTPVEYWIRWETTDGLNFNLSTTNHDISIDLGVTLQLPETEGMDIIKKCFTIENSSQKEIYQYGNGQWNLIATDTTGATITDEDIVEGKYGFANGGKIAGKINKVANTTIELWTPHMINEEETESIICKTEPMNDYFANTDLITRIYYGDLASLINLTSDKIIEGKKVLNIEGAAESEVAAFAKSIVERGTITIIPEGITKVGTYAFAECTGLAATKLPKGVTSIADYGFYRCRQLALTELPEGLETVGKWAFKGCTKLALTKLPESLTEIGFECFSDCVNLTITKIPQKITIINGYIFSGCTGITELTCEGEIKTVDSYGFYGCSNLIKIAMPNITTVPKLRNINAFKNTPIEKGTGYIYVPDNLVDSFKTAENWSTYADQIKSINEMEE